MDEVYLRWDPERVMVYLLGHLDNGMHGSICRNEGFSLMPNVWHLYKAALWGSGGVVNQLKRFFENKNMFREYPQRVGLCSHMEVSAQQTEGISWQCFWLCSSGNTFLQINCLFGLLLILLAEYRSCSLCDLQRLSSHRCLVLPGYWCMKCCPWKQATTEAVTPAKTSSGPCFSASCLFCTHSDWSSGFVRRSSAQLCWLTCWLSDIGYSHACRNAVPAEKNNSCGVC